MALITRWLIPLTAWAGALFGCLQLHTLDLGHSICGARGCGPPASALLAMHSFWLVILLPAGLVAPRLWPKVNWRTIGKWLFIAAAITILLIGVFDFASFQRDPTHPVYVWQRFLFRLATLPDWPVVQLGLAGALIWRTNVKPHSEA